MEKNRSGDNQPNATDKGPVLNIKELKHMEFGDVVKLAKEVGVEGAAHVPVRDLRYRVIRSHASNHGTVIAEGVLEKLNAL